MSEREAFEKLQKYIPPWIVFDDEKSEYKLSEKALNSEENHEIKNSYNREWWIFKSAVEHCKQGEPVAYADPQAFSNFKANPEVIEKEWMWSQPDTGFIPLFTHAMPKSEYKPVNPEYYWELDDGDWTIPADDVSQYALDSDRREGDEFELMAAVCLGKAKFNIFDGEPVLQSLEKSLFAIPQPYTDVSELVQALKWSLEQHDVQEWESEGAHMSGQCAKYAWCQSIIAKHTVK